MVLGTSSSFASEEKSQFLPWRLVKGPGGARSLSVGRSVKKHHKSKITIEIIIIKEIIFVMEITFVIEIIFVMEITFLSSLIRLALRTTYIVSKCHFIE